MIAASSPRNRIRTRTRFAQVASISLLQTAARCVNANGLDELGRSNSNPRSAREVSGAHVNLQCPILYSERQMKMFEIPGLKFAKSIVIRHLQLQEPANL
jgi:hypothetical protein